MKNTTSFLLKHDNTLQKRSWHDFPFKKKSPPKTLHLLDYGFFLFNTSLKNLDFSKLNVDSDSYDSGYEKTVRNELTEILYTLDDSLENLCGKHFDVISKTFALESMLLSPEFYQKILFDQSALDLKNLIIPILEALHSSVHLLVLMENQTNKTHVHSLLKQINTLLCSHPWEIFDESQAITLFIGQTITPSLGQKVSL